MGEVDHAEDAVDHAESDTDERVEESEHQPVGGVLQEFVQGGHEGAPSAAILTVARPDRHARA